MKPMWLFTFCLCLIILITIFTYIFTKSTHKIVEEAFEENLEVAEEAAPVA